MVDERDGDQPEKLRVSVWRRTISPSATWRALGVTQPFDTYLVIDVWRGRDISKGVAAWVHDLTSDTSRVVAIPGGSLAAGGAAPLVAYVGHNRWMDDLELGWRDAGDHHARGKGVFAIACYTRDYLAAALARDGHVPLVLTKDFVMASGAALLGGLDALVEGGGLEKIRRGAGVGYATAGRKDVARVSGVFVNESSPRW